VVLQYSPEQVNGLAQFHSLQVHRWPNIIRSYTGRWVGGPTVFPPVQILLDNRIPSVEVGGTVLFVPSCSAYRNVSLCILTEVGNFHLSSNLEISGYQDLTCVPRIPALSITCTVL
jgi:hypothetical protein